MSVIPYSIAELLNQGANARTIQAAIDLTLQEVSADGATYQDGLFDPALRFAIASASYENRSVAWMKVKKFRPRIQHIRGIDGEVLMDRRHAEVSMEDLGSINISGGAIWTEQDYLRLDQLRMLGQNLTRGGTAYQELLDTFLQVPRDLTLGIEQTWLLMALRTVVFGNPTYTDPRSGVTYSVDYTGSIPAGNLAAQLTTTARWSQLSTATGIANLVAHLNVFFNGVKRFPTKIAMARADADNLCSQDSTKILVARNKSTITDGQAISDASNLPKATLEDVRLVLQQELTTTNMPAPEIITTDAIYYTADGTAASFLPENYYVFLTDNMVEAARVPTILDIRARNTGNGRGLSSAGYTIVAKSTDDIPARDSLKADSAGMIICPDPRFIGSRKVE